MQGAYAIGTAIGQGLHSLFFPSPEDQARKAQEQARRQAEQQARSQAQQQLELAANQLYASGMYLFKHKNYAGAITEFQKALTYTPYDRAILNSLALARQALKDTAVAGQTSSALTQLLGKAPANTSAFDFDLLTHSSFANPNASALSLVNLDSDTSVVDLRGTTTTSVDPALVQGGSVNPATLPSDVQHTLLTLDNVLDNGSSHDLKRQLDAFANTYLPQHPSLNTAQSAPDARTPSRNQKLDAEQSTKEALDQVLDQNQSAAVQPLAGLLATGNAPQTISSSPPTQQANSPLLNSIAQPDFDGRTTGNAVIGRATSPQLHTVPKLADLPGVLPAQSRLITPDGHLKDTGVDPPSNNTVTAGYFGTAIARPAFRSSSSDEHSSQEARSGFDSPGETTSSSVVDLRGKSETVDPSLLNGSLPTPSSIGSEMTPPVTPFLASANTATVAVDPMAKVHREITAVQGALRQLERSMTLDASQREEWEKESADATRDAYFTAGDLSLMVIGSHLDEQLREQRLELARGEDVLIGVTDPSRREQLQLAIGAMTKRRDELDHVKEVVAAGAAAFDVAHNTSDSAVGAASNPVELAYAACDHLGVFREWVGYTKTALDASYEAVAQAVSTHRLSALNNNSEQYRLAVDVLTQRMRRLVAIESTLKAAQVTGDATPNVGNVVR